MRGAPDLTLWGIGQIGLKIVLIIVKKNISDILCELWEAVVTNNVFHLF